MKKFSFTNQAGRVSIAKIVAAFGMLVILGAGIAANILASAYGDVITLFFYGTGESVGLLESSELAEEIASEGILLLKNEKKTLPLTDAEIEKGKINVFGWGASGYASEDSSKNYMGGFVMSGSGSGNADVSKAKRLLNALEEEGFMYNEELMDIAKEYRIDRPNEGWTSGGGSNWTASLQSHSHQFFRLYEPEASRYNQEVMDRAAGFSDIAMIVISRLGGEGKDLPTVQYKSTEPTGSKRIAEINNLYTTDATRTYAQISTEEEALIRHVASESRFKKIILVLNTCNIMELGFIEDPANRIDAVLSVGALGTSGALAVPRILKGVKQTTIVNDAGEQERVTVQFSPSAKTVDTWAYRQIDDPTYINGGQNYYLGSDLQGYAVSPSGGHMGVMTYTDGNGRYIDYQEGIYLGYRYFETAAAEGVIDYKSTVQFPFGFGLSYTEFTWRVDNVSLSTGGTELKKNSEIVVDVFVKNTGDWAGQDVVQVYVTAPYVSELEKSHVVLTAFGKTELLEPGDEQKIELKFEAYDFASYDCYGLNSTGFQGYVLEAGDYEIKVQSDSHNLAKNPQTGVVIDDAVTKFTVPSLIKFDTVTQVTDSLSETTKTLQFAKNYFTGADADGGVPIDGKAGANATGVNGGAGIEFLSRTDFEETFPDADSKKPARSASYNNSLITPSWFDATEEVTGDDHPTTATDSGLRLSYDDNASEQEIQEIKNTMLKLGKNYNDPLWDDLLNQMSVADLYLLVQNGGYKTAEISSIGKPLVWNLDGPSGLNVGNASIRSSEWTAFPVTTIVGQTWSRKLAYFQGLAVGAEAKLSNVAGWYAPGINLHRGAFAGRNFEYFSEDGAHTGIMAAELTLGALENGLYCYAKHYVVNDLETHRGGLKTWLTEQALRELYLKPFEICVKRGRVSGIMSAFNTIGPIWTGGSKPLCNYILRDEWGFVGSMVTDYASGLGSGYMTASQGLRAGNDLWLTGLDGGGSQIGNQGSALWFVAPLDRDINQSNSSSNMNFTESGRILLRRSAKNILFSHANAYWYSNNVDTGTGRFAIDASSIIRGEMPFGWWGVWGLLPLNLVLLGAFGCILYFVFFHEKKRT